MTYHPDITLLEAYVSGDIDAVTGLTVATHLETCAICRQTVAKLEEQNASHLDGLEEEYDPMFDDMMATILSAEPKKDVIEVNEEVSVNVAGKDFVLPQSMARFADLIGEWRSYGGKVFSAEVDFGEDAHVNLMYISENVAIPQHTHKGIEQTLVLHGGFSDEDGHYHEGDFLLRDSSVEHSPYTKQGEDCLCLTVLTEPMLFTKGIARVFNRFGKGMYP